MVDKKKEIISTCLETFVREGLIEISMRDLGKSLSMDPAGFYYYFKNRDELVIACAEEAKQRIEEELFGIALQNIDNPEMLSRKLTERAVEMRPLMCFFVSVCTSKRYKEAIQPSLHRLSQRYIQYIEMFAEKLNAKAEIIAPHVYTVINTMLSFMLFGQSNFNAPQLEFSRKALENLLEKQGRKE